MDLLTMLVHKSWRYGVTKLKTNSPLIVRNKSYRGFLGVLGTYQSIFIFIISHISVSLSITKFDIYIYFNFDEL